MPIFEKAEKALMRSILDSFRCWFDQQGPGMTTPGLGVEPSTLIELREIINRILRDPEITNPHVATNIDSKYSPILKRIIIWARRREAASIEFRENRTTNPEIIAKIEKELEPLTRIMNESWFTEVEAYKLPSHIDFITLEECRKLSENRTKFKPRIYDEKFHTLYSPSLFLDDLEYFRAECEMRSIPLAVAFIDIDNLKKYNSEFGETYVDRYMLPVFMSALENHVFGHGFAYRVGGDEYIVLLINMVNRWVVSFLKDFQDKISKLEYKDIKSNPTVSIGFVFVEEDCFLTDREIRDKACEAKSHAKSRNKNCVGTYAANLFSKEDLTLI